MLERRGLDTRSHKAVRVYVRPLGEGTLVFRPAMGLPVGRGVVRLIEPPDYNPEDEEWEFGPGSVVKLERQTFADGSRGKVAVSRLSD